MQKLISSTFVTLISIVFFMFSCRKADNNFSPISDKLVAVKFLQLPSTASSQLKRIAQKLEALHQQHGFLNDIAREDGYPVWDKTITHLSNSTGTKYRTQYRQSNATDTIIYIPLVLANANRVSAFIYARLNDSIQLQLHRGSDYESYGFGNIEDSTDNAERLTLQLMVLNNEVYGYTKFKLLDKRLFAKANFIDTSLKMNERYLELKDSTYTNNNARARWEEGSITYCIFTPEKLHCTKTGKCASGTCDRCYLCVTPGSWECNTTVQYYFIPGDDWSTIGITGQSGGGGGSSSYEPIDKSNNDDDDGIAEIKEISNQIKNKCLSITLNNSISKGLENDITNILHIIFGASKDFNIVFYDSSLNNNLIDGKTTPLIWSSGRMDFKIVLNIDVLPYASKEYITATIYHEILHAYLRTTGLKGDLQHHTSIANNYTTKLSNSLMNAFPNLDPADAKALSWGGLAETTAYDSIRTNHPSEFTDLILRNSQHRVNTNNTKGTPCN